MPKFIKSTVYVYCGTFDPFHENHKKICDWCLAQPNAKLVIHINYRPFSMDNKKQPASWEIRSNIIHAVFDKEVKENIEICPQEDFHSTMQRLHKTYPNAEIVQVIGSDVLEQVSDQAFIKGYAQHVRTKDVVSTLHRLNDKPLITIPLELPLISSTQIRLGLMEEKKEEVSSMLPIKAIDVILMAEEYSPLSISMRDLMKKQLSIPNEFSSHLKNSFESPFYLEDKTYDYQGKSGDAIIAVKKKNEMIAICKLFRLGAQSCEMEVQKHNLLEQFVKVPFIHFTLDNIVCMQYIAGKNPQTAKDFEYVGQAYYELHNKSRMANDKLCEPCEVTQLKEKISILCRRISDNIISQNVKSIFEKLLISYSNSLHKFATIHGDVQPGNVLLINDEVTFIDFANVKQEQDPARDVNQMVASIYWKAYQKNAVNEQDISILEENINAFLKAYSYKMITPADRFWNFYWQAKIFIVALEKPKLPLSLHIISNFNNSLLSYSSVENSMNRFFLPAEQAIENNVQVNVRKDSESVFGEVNTIS